MLGNVKTNRSTGNLIQYYPFNMTNLSESNRVFLHQLGVIQLNTENWKLKTENKDHIIRSLLFLF